MQTVRSGRRSVGSLIAVAALLVAGGVVMAWPASGYTITEFGPAEPAEQSVASAVNSSGVVVGHIIDVGGHARAVRWSANGTRTFLRGLSARGDSYAYAVNATGQATGGSVRPAGDYIFRSGGR